MKEYKSHAKSLSQLYTFYDRLETDFPENRRGAYYIKRTAERVTNQTFSQAFDSSDIRAQAAAELAKEKKLLSEKFGFTVPFDEYTDGKDFKEVIDLLNECLNLKKIYERSKNFIKNTEGRKGVYSYFPSYFGSVFEKFWGNKYKEIESKFSPEDPTPIAQIIQAEVQPHMDELCQEAIRNMLLKAKTEVDPEKNQDLQDAYKDLEASIGSIYTKGSIAQELYKIYKLDEVLMEIADQADKNRDFNDNKTFSKTVSNRVSMGFQQKSGLALEIIYHAVLESCEAIASGGGTALHIGQKGTKGDELLSFNIDSNVIEDAMNKAKGDRKTNVEAFNELGNRLKQLDNGFIVYVSEKNYGINNDFASRGGFSSGNPQNAQSFLESLGHLGSGINTLLGAIQSMGKGAILSDSKGNYETYLAQKVAYMLFDDYTTIGDVSQGGNAIHVMNLSGVVIPLSVILSMLAEAIESLDERNVRRVVSVKINAPKIKFPTQESQEAAYPENPHDAWEDQRQYALDQTTITAHFLANFKSLIGML